MGDIAIVVLLALETRRQPAPAKPVRIRESFARMPRVLAQRPVQGLLATGSCEGLLIFGALAFLPACWSRFTRWADCSTPRSRRARCAFR